MKKPSLPLSDASGQNLVQVAAIDRLAEILRKYDLSEVEVAVGELHVRLAREKAFAAAQQTADVPVRAPAVVPASAEEAPASSAETVKSPLVGTAYLRPSPEAKAFVEIGSVVRSGDKLLLVEAMKTFNDIVAPRPGKVLDILVSDGSPVEYGQPLVVIE
jgi:acetyl-CoA carboxylase biotin carboxyl carrier protein